MEGRDFSAIRSNGGLPGHQGIEMPVESAEFLNNFTQSTNSALEELEAAALACGTGSNCPENTATARRILHSIKGEAGIIGIADIYELCHQAEFAVEELDAAKVPDMLLNVKDWICAALRHLSGRTVDDLQTNKAKAELKKDSKIRCLIVEDDFTARKLLQACLSDYADYDIAANGKEAVEAFKEALEQGSPYELICLDIMMPDMNGHDVLMTIRQAEKQHGIFGDNGVKVIMTTALADSEESTKAFKEGCEAYIIKPVSKKKLLAEVEKLGLIPAGV